jgi:hypothetical protein
MMTQEQMIREIEALRAANSALKQANEPKPRGLSLKVAPKGGISVYGLGRFPVTLYASQWESLINQADTIKTFIDTNRSTLASKGA